MRESISLEKFGLRIKEYSPSEIARTLTNDYGHKVTPSVIRKWDNLILSKTIKKDRRKGAVRKYHGGDVRAFSIIAVLRNLGYSIQDTRELINIIFNYKAIMDKGSDAAQRCEEMLKELAEHLGKQQGALAQANMFLTTLLKPK